MEQKRKPHNPTGKRGPQILPPHLRTPVDPCSERATAVRVSIVLAAAGKTFDVNPAVITKQTKLRPVVEARTAAMYILWHELKISISAIARFLRKDRSTVVCALQRATERINTDPAYADTIKHILKRRQ